MQTVNTYYTNYDSLKEFVKKHQDMLFDKKNRSVLIQVFSGICDRKFLEDLISQITGLVPHAQIIGATTGGEIMDGKVSSLETVLSFSVFKHTDVHTAIALPEDGGSFELGRTIASSLAGGQHQLLILFSAGKSVNPDQMLAGVESVNPRLPIAGGIAGDNFFNMQSFAFCNGKITDCGVVGASLEGGQLSINQHWHLCWQPIGKVMTITKADGSRVYTIDHIPAFEVYREYLGVERNSSIVYSLFPLMTKRNGIDVVRTPSLIYGDGSIEFMSEIKEGEKVRFSYGHVDMILESVDKLLHEIKSQPAESIFVYSCVLRRGYLQDSTEIETLPLQDIAATAGFFTHGEFFHSNGTNHLLNATMTTLVLSEHKKTEPKPPAESASSRLTADMDITAGKDNVKSANIAILKALTYLVNSETKELSERTAELEKVYESVQYNSTHDSLTGLYNRGFYEDKMKSREPEGIHSLGIIMCDVDGLKLINDTLGHRTGDIILKATADILKLVINRSGIAARIGGDEFSALIPDCSRPDIEAACEQIRQSAAGYNGSHPNVPLSISIGFAYSDDTSKDFADTNRLFKEADNNMYREKLHRSKSIRSDLVHTLVKALEARDIITESHSNRLEKLIADFADYIGCSKNDCSGLQLFARFHDIGKVGIPDHILFKPGKLTPKETKEMQRHCEIGFRIAQSSNDLLPLSDWILKHHEWWNGKGYPLGLKGEDIPVECRILAVADAYDAMTCNRPYRKAMSHKAALEELKRFSAIQFDPCLVQQFLYMMESKTEQETAH